MLKLNILLPELQHAAGGSTEIEYALLVVLELNMLLLVVLKLNMLKLSSAAKVPQIVQLIKSNQQIKIFFDNQTASRA